MAGASDLPMKLSVRPVACVPVAPRAPTWHAACRRRHTRMRSTVAGLRVLLVAVFVIIAPSVGATQTRDSVELPGGAIVVIQIPPGHFQMGSDRSIHANDKWKPCPACPTRNEAERPVHPVTISRAFWMGAFPVTQQQWRSVMGMNPSRMQAAGPDAPVEQVSFRDVQAFLAKVNALQTRWRVRLPSEAEWEYAARAGTVGDTYGPLDRIAWYGGNGRGTTHPVGQKAPNPFGLYDMLGNVWQWCQDWFGPYPDSAVTDPHGPAEGDHRVTRGGCFYCDAIHERAARRNRDTEDHASQSIGFRIVAVPADSH